MHMKNAICERLSPTGGGRDVDALPISRTTEFGGFGRGWFDREVSYKKVEKV
jgi:hypothetical protein